MLPISRGQQQTVRHQPDPDLPAITFATPPNPYTGGAADAAWVFAPSQSGGRNYYEAHCNFYKNNGGANDANYTELDELIPADGARQLAFSDYGKWISRYPQPGTSTDWAASIPRAAATIQYWHGLRFNNSINVYHSPVEVSLNASGYGFFGAGGYTAYPGTPNFWTTVIMSHRPFVFIPFLLEQNALAAAIPADRRLWITGVCARWAVSDTVDTYRADWSAYSIGADTVEFR